MFNWCAWCQHLIGEAEPLDDYRISHGMCVACSQGQGAGRPHRDFLRARSIFKLLEKAGRGGSLDACEKVIDGALDYGLKPSDIIVGILHPALYRIGELWERGEITVADEHRFTAFALGLIDRFRFSEPPAERPLIILANHPESLHDVGLRILQILSWEHGIPCERIPARTSEEALLDAASKRSPTLFGLSISLAETIPAAVELAESLADPLPDTSKVILGGHAFRRSEGFLSPDSIPVIRSIDEFLALLLTIKDQELVLSGLMDPPRQKPN